MLVRLLLLLFEILGMMMDDDVFCNKNKMMQRFLSKFDRNDVRPHTYLTLALLDKVLKVEFRFLPFLEFSFCSSFFV